MLCALCEDGSSGPEFGKCCVLYPIHADLHFKLACQSLRSDMVKHLFRLCEPNISQCLLNEWIKEKSSQIFYFLSPYWPSILLTVHLMSWTLWYQEELITPWSACTYFGRQTLVSRMENRPWEEDLFSNTCQGCSQCEGLAHFCHPCPQVKVTSPGCRHLGRPWLDCGHFLSSTAAKCGPPLPSCPGSCFPCHLVAAEG